MSGGSQGWMWCCGRLISRIWPLHLMFWARKGWVLHCCHLVVPIYPCCYPQLSSSSSSSSSSPSSAHHSLLLSPAHHCCPLLIIVVPCSFVIVIIVIPYSLFILYQLLFPVHHHPSHWSLLSLPWVIIPLATPWVEACRVAHSRVGGHCP